MGNAASFPHDLSPPLAVVLFLSLFLVKELHVRLCYGPHVLEEMERAAEKQHCLFVPLTNSHTQHDSGGEFIAGNTPQAYTIAFM
jgi:hypothetical protein